ncbi:MAG: twin transmembrane helix small protein [Neptuniibacter sp.]|uniref:twin transmembrane helix small protein n=1 Tax=Neptuniibacter sp. TaxID=1962643 RepID=UPI003B5AC8CA
MSLKLLLLILFAAVVISLFCGLFFLIRDQGKSHRTVNSLFFRVAFSVLIILVLIYGFYTGELRPHFP